MNSHDHRFRLLLALGSHKDPQAVLGEEGYLLDDMPDCALDQMADVVGIHCHIRVHGEHPERSLLAVELRLHNCDQDRMHLQRREEEKDYSLHRRMDLHSSCQQEATLLHSLRYVRLWS